MLRYYRYCALFVIILTNAFSAPDKPDETGTAQTLHYAKNFKINDFKTHSIVTVHNSSDNSTPSYQYALVPEGAPVPDLPEDCLIIRTPVERIVVLETIHIGFLNTLEQLDCIIGAGTADYISNPTVRQGIEKGSIQKIQTARTISTERLLLLKPDLIFTSAPSEPAFNISTQLARSGLPVVITDEYKEHHPLARAEWIKFIAAFFDAQEEANEVFNAIAERYETLLRKVDALEERPTVFCGAPYSGIWHMAEGDSYMAQLIHDAGGNYLWSDVTGKGAIPLDVERVFSKAAKADIWLNPGIYRNWQTLFAADLRFNKFYAARTGHIYNNTRQQTAETGNPIWETGIVNPDRVLADLIKIFHPHRIPDWEFVYYERME